MDHRISVVVAVRNDGKGLERCLPALHAQTLRPLEIIVVDGHSSDNSIEVAQRFGARTFTEDYGTPAGGRQVGIGVAVGDYVAFTDADCVPDSHWLEALATAFAPGLAGVGGRIVNEAHSFWENSIGVALDTLAGGANSVQGRGFDTPRFVSSISGCNSMYRREELIGAGGLRTDLVTTEDTELNRRMSQDGKLLYVPSAVVYHNHRRGPRAFAKRMMEYGFGRGQSLLLGPQLAIPFGVVTLLLLSLVNLDLVAVLLLLYLACLVGFGVLAGIRYRSPGLLVGVPSICVIEHVCYTLGFWAGLSTHVMPSRRSALAVGGRPR